MSGLDLVASSPLDWLSVAVAFAVNWIAVMSLGVLVFRRRQWTKSTKVLLTIYLVASGLAGTQVLYSTIMESVRLGVQLAPIHVLIQMTLGFSALWPIFLLWALLSRY